MSSSWKPARRRPWAVPRGRQHDDIIRLSDVSRVGSTYGDAPHLGWVAPVTDRGGPLWTLL
jgi:hypothetical protein